MVVAEKGGRGRERNGRPSTTVDLLCSPTSSIRAAWDRENLACSGFEFCVGLS